MPIDFERKIEVHKNAAQLYEQLGIKTETDGLKQSYIGLIRAYLEGEYIRGKLKGAEENRRILSGNIPRITDRTGRDTSTS